jgi:DNA-directed RNA polymerase subunit RPC12/RpoP
MNIRFSCADCGKEYKVPEKFAGKKVKCKKCGAKIRVPSEEEGAAKSEGSTRKSKREPAASASTEKAKSKRTPAKRKSPSIKTMGRSPSGTMLIEVPNLEAEKKAYESKKKEEKAFARGTGRLVYFKDGKAVKSYRLDNETRVVGSDDGCNICIADDSVSKEHCKIEVRLGKFTLTDLRSSNGTVVNHKKVRRASLSKGDLIQLGRAVFRIDCG